LEVRTKNNLPIDWATTQSNLGTAYINRIKGKRFENLEKSIDSYESALPIIADSGFLKQLEILKDDLTKAYLQRVGLTATSNSNFSSNRDDQTNNTLQQLTQTCINQSEWYKATLSLSLWSQALISQKANVQAAHLLLQAINLDIQYNPQLIDTDLQEFASLMTHLDWKPDGLTAQWQIA
jgi:hypothetical protein